MQYVNYDAIIKNAQYFKQVLGKSKLCAVVKCDAYGHGIERVASCLCDIVDCFAVNDVLEGQKIARYGKDVLILLPQNARNAKIAIENRFILTLDSFDTLQILKQFSKDFVRVHIKIDSGMSRLGFRLEDLSQLMRLLDSKNIVVEGIFTHFYSEDQISCREQLNYFEKCGKIVSRKFGNITKHIANTCGVMLSKELHLDMARVGLGLYGYGAPNLYVAKTVTAKVVAKKKVSMGSIVGYGATYTCNCDTDVAVIDIGYAKGYVRSLCRPIVKVGDKFTNIIGNICMSMCMIDVTNMLVSVGDEVIVLGEDVNPSTDDAIIYQLLCNLR